MTNKPKNQKEDVNKNSKSGAEKPVSLWGASLTEGLQALLKTKPIPKNKEESDKDAKKRN